MRYLTMLIFFFIPFLLFAGNGRKICPAELSYFKASWQDELVKIDWATNSEENTDKFVVKRAVAQQGAVGPYEVVAEVQAAGSSTEKKEYTVNDTDFIPGAENAYKLEIHDKDGSFETSEILMVDIDYVFFDCHNIFFPKKEDNRVVISWGTIYEAEIDSFKVTRGVQGVYDDEVIIAVKAKGNSDSTELYGPFIDESPYYGYANKYQLFIKLNSGEEIKISLMVLDLINSVSDRSENFTCTIAPNPFAGSTKLNIQTEQPGNINIELYDSYGTLILSDNIQNTGREYIYNLMAPNIASGIYFLKLEMNGIVKQEILSISR